MSFSLRRAVAAAHDLTSASLLYPRPGFCSLSTSKLPQLDIHSRFKLLTRFCETVHGFSVCQERPVHVAVSHLLDKLFYDLLFHVVGISIVDLLFPFSLIAFPLPGQLCRCGREAHPAGGSMSRGRRWPPSAQPYGAPDPESTGHRGSNPSRRSRSILFYFSTPLPCPH